MSRNSLCACGRKVYCKGVCRNCHAKAFRVSNPDYYKRPKNGFLCLCGCGEECRGSKRIRWLSGHKKSVAWCICGCGTEVGKNAIYVQGHQPRTCTDHAARRERMAKVGRSGRGRRFTMEHRRKISVALKKKTGTSREMRRRIRGWATYRQWRNAVYERDDFTCTNCGVRGGSIQADHVSPIAVSPELAFSLSNGRTLCVACHKKTDSYGHRVKSLPGYKPNAVFSVTDTGVIP